MSHHLVETIDLCFSYPDSPPALNRVSLRITTGNPLPSWAGTERENPPCSCTSTACWSPPPDRCG